MKLIFCDINELMIKAWNKYISQDANVEIYHGSIFALHTDAIVSPANSFGFMDGGLDLQISRFFGWHIQERLQEIIKQKHHGELLVGNAEIVETDHDIIPFVISVVGAVPFNIDKTDTAFVPKEVVPIPTFPSSLTIKVLLDPVKLLTSKPIEAEVLVEP